MDLRLEEATQYVQDHPEDSVRSVSRLFDVKRSTLRNRLNGARPRKGRPGVNKLFSEAEEKAICNYIDRTERASSAVRSAFVTDAANVILAARHTSRDEPPPTVGINWTARFMKRHGYSQRTKKLSEPQTEPAENPACTAESSSSSSSSSQPDDASSPPACATETRNSITLQQLDMLSERIESSLNHPDLGINTELARRLTRLVKSALLEAPDLLLVQAKHDPSRSERVQRRRQREPQVESKTKESEAETGARVRKAAKKSFAEAAKEARRRRISGRLDPAEILASGAEPKRLRRF